MSQKGFPTFGSFCPAKLNKDLEDGNVVLNRIMSPPEFRPACSFFPAMFIKDLEGGSENTSSETAENGFIKGLPKDDSWDYELKQP
ncbi:unnamed protein product [Rodentolepis nana]|uniref:AGC-kinase C-terminal domain-containing protein n=1 Tax=Rodentolepis nana TaxID=102285 RepID=A0A0R3TBB9_RODNA|nr:unnamed protein product [Rodentolepis nana]